MKRLLGLMLCLCLPWVALAESTPAHVTERLSSNTGYTSITIDAEVIAPEAQTIPRYQVKLREFSEDEVYAMAEALLGKYSYTGSSSYKDNVDRVSGRLGWRSMDFQTTEQVPYGDASGAWLPLYHLSVTTSLNTMTGAIERVNAQLGRAQQIGKPSFFDGTNYMAKLPEDGPIGCAISRADAQALTDEAVASFAPWMKLAAVGAMQAEVVSDDFQSDYVQDHQGWAFFYTRDLPLPVTYESSEPTQDYNVEVWREVITLVVDDDGIQAMQYNQPIEITQVLDDDCELLAFDQIMDIARTILPLRYAYEEGSFEDIRAKIDRITLGYMVTFSRSGTASCELIPVWDFFGRVDFNGNDFFWDKPFQALLTISAIDGTIIDRSYGY